MAGLIFIVLGLFLSWQSIGAYHWFSWCNRLIIPKFNENLYCMVAGSAVCNFGLFLGVVGIALGVVYILDSKGVLNHDNSGKGKMSYFGILVFMGIASAVTLL